MKFFSKLVTLHSGPESDQDIIVAKLKSITRCVKQIENGVFRADKTALLMSYLKSAFKDSLTVINCKKEQSSSPVRCCIAKTLEMMVSCHPNIISPIFQRMVPIVVDYLRKKFFPLEKPKRTKQQFERFIPLLFDYATLTLTNYEARQTVFNARWDFSKNLLIDTCHAILCENWPHTYPYLSDDCKKGIDTLTCVMTFYKLPKDTISMALHSTVIIWLYTQTNKE